MKWDEVRELAPLYALGALDNETARRVEALLRKATPDQQREIAEWREVAALLAEALPQPSPHAIFKDRLLQRINDLSQETPIETAIAESSLESPPLPPQGRLLPFDSARRAESKITRWLLAAATILLSFTAAYLFWQNSKLRGERGKLLDEIGALRRQFDSVVSPATKVIEMAGDEAPQANAKVLWDKKSHQWVIYIYDLPMPPPDKDYQLWYVTSDAKISAAVFRPDAQGRTVLRLSLPSEALKGLAATAVTLEPRGGSDQPTGKFYFKAAI
jgi:anti-sigma-K factor RskA